MREALQPIIDKVWRHCEGSGIRGRTVTLKVKYADFELITRSRTAPEPIHSKLDMESISVNLLMRLFPIPKGVRLLGVSLSALGGDDPAETSQMQLGL
jgi:DNA polymerase-4